MTTPPVTPEDTGDGLLETTSGRTGVNGHLYPADSHDERYLLQAFAFDGLLRARLYRYTRNRSDVEELLQEVYVRLLAVGSENPPAVRSVRALALTIARNIATDWHRRRHGLPVDFVADFEALDISDNAAPIDEVVHREQELARLAEAIRSLPRRCRRVVELYLDGFSYADIAVQLGISENTVRDHLRRAGRLLPQALFRHPPAERRASTFHAPPDAEETP